MTFFDQNPVGRIVNRISGDTVKIDDNLPYNFHEFCSLIVFSIAYPIGIVIFFPWIAISFIMCILLMVYFYRQFRAANRELKRLSSVNNGKLLTIINENCTGLSIIRSFS